mgnify:CR=1 FL=1
MAKIRLLAVILLIGLFLIAGCTSRKSGSPTTSIPVPSTEYPAEDGVEEIIVAEEEVIDQESELEEISDIIESAVKEFDITAKKWDFTPSTITVNQGDKVILHITSTDVKHGFGLTDFGVKGDLNPGETTTIEFTADKKGTFTFFCSVQCGSGHSEMKGKLIVE